MRWGSASRTTASKGPIPGKTSHIVLGKVERQQRRPHGRIYCSSDQLYRLLSIPPDATQIEIDLAYKRILRRFKDPNAKSRPTRSKWEASLLAYEVLSSPSLRSLYDLGGLGALSGRHAALKDLMSLSRGNLKRLLYIDLEEAAHGVHKSVMVKVLSECNDCGGKGCTDDCVTSCDKCGGQGVVTISRRNMKDPLNPQICLEAGVCPFCGGTGEESRQLCKACRGRGIKIVERTVRIRIPAGIESGAMLTAKGYGSLPVVGSKNGDLLIGVIVRSHTLYRREGQDIYSMVDVPLQVAMLGGVVQVSTVWGIENLRIPPGTQHKDNLPLPQAGLPCQGSSSRGTHICTVKIIIPHRDSFEGTDVLLQLEQLL